MKAELILMIIITIVLTGCSSPAETEAPAQIAQETVETDCPFGEINDPFPGSCGRYIDRNGNDICDLSEITP